MKSFHIGQGDPSTRHHVSHPIDWTTGCAMFMSVDTYRRLGPLDEEFFLYLEDVDWCLRGAAHGIQTRFVAEAVIDHEVSMTVRSLPPGEVRYYAYRNYYRLAFRHAPRWARPLIGADIGWTLVKIAVRWTLFPSYRRDAYYHARTWAVLDALRRRWGPSGLSATSNKKRGPIATGRTEVSPRP
jgi:GT2 family glycosyltransferase